MVPIRQIIPQISMVSFYAKTFFKIYFNVLF